MLCLQNLSVGVGMWVGGKGRGCFGLIGLQQARFGREGNLTFF